MSETAGRADWPRYSEAPLPPYSYVPGHWPHPVSDPRGHMHGEHQVEPPALDPQDWSASGTYRYAVDLFNHGFYWESHEAWEALWHAAGRQGPVATWLKALIKLAAAAVKLREGNANGVERHVQRARELLAELRYELPSETEIYAGVTFVEVNAIADQLLADATVTRHADPNRALSLRLVLR